MNRFPRLENILRIYRDRGYSQYQRAKVIFILNITALLILALVMIYIIFVTKELSPVMMFAQSMGIILLICNTVLLSRGWFASSANMLFIMTMAVIWLTIFFDRNDPIVRLDSIAYILGLLPLAALVTWRKRRPIVIYGISNILILTVFIYFNHDELGISSLAKYDYLIDNILSILFITILSYQVVTINNRSLAVAESEITERKKTEFELIKKNRELEDMNQQHMATMEELEATNEEYEAQHNEILQSQQDLIESEQRFRNILEFLPFPIILTTSDEVLFINQAYTRRYGYTIDDFPSVSKAWELIFPDPAHKDEIIAEYTEKLNASGKDKIVHIEAKQFRCKNGTEAVVEMSITRSGSEIVMVADDITEKIHSQQLLIQSEKMMTVGNLAAGMAHEINNPLGIILQSVQNAFRRISPDNEKNTAFAEELKTDLKTINAYLEERGVNKYLSAIQDASKRAATIVSNMLHFTRKSNSELILLNINELIDRSIEIASQDYNLKQNYDVKKITFVRNVDQDIPEIPGIRNELEQVLLNLIKNAAQAMYDAGTETDEKKITISISRLPGKIQIQIEDTGPGISEEDQKKIFDPFFTTKKAGAGTGLGLFVCYSIITNRHKGEIFLNSMPGSGAQFTLRLPL